MAFFNEFLILVGRIFISALFLWAAFAKIFNLKGTNAYMKEKKVPLIFLMMPLAILLQLVGGLSILIGFYTRIGALILIIFIIPATLKLHRFWGLTGVEKDIEKSFFMKDVAILGGLLFLIVWGPGYFSLDHYSLLT